MHLGSGHAHLELSETLHILSRVIAELCEKPSTGHISPPLLTRAKVSMLNLLESSGRHKVSELSRLYNVSPPAATKTIDKLEKLGLVERVFANGDRRFVWVAITEKGRRAIRKYRKAYQEKISEALEDFSSPQLSSFRKLLEKFINAALQEAPSAFLVCLECQGKFTSSCRMQEHLKRCLFMSYMEDRKNTPAKFYKGDAAYG